MPESNHPTTAPTRTAEPSQVVTSWEPPPWAGTSTALEAGGVEHYRRIGELFPVDGEQPAVSVSVSQVDELTPSAGLVAVHRQPAEVIVAGVRLSPAEAYQLGEILLSAVSMLEGNWTP